MDTSSVRAGWMRGIADAKDAPEGGGKPVEFKLEVKECSHLVYSLRAVLKSSMDAMADAMSGAGVDPDLVLDEVRYYTSDKYIFRFIVTSVISALHMYLSYLAFRDELKFYRVKTRRGVSLSSVWFTLASDAVVWLYLQDAGAGAVVLASVGMDVAVAAYKCIRLSRPRLAPTFPFVRLGKETEEEETDSLDVVAVKNVTAALTPLFVGFAAYSYTKYKYRSTYSFLVDIGSDAVYYAGFIKMTPQIYVNWKLKSVAHLTPHMLVYKVFNTLIDDVFAWMMQSPLKHKLMCMRDDVVFAVVVVQMLIYRVDKTRSNDFGVAFEKGGGDDGAENNDNKRKND